LIFGVLTPLSEIFQLYHGDHAILVVDFLFPGGSMSWVVGLPNNSYKPITNTAWVRARLCKLQKRVQRLAAASVKVYQLLAHGR
jgi:hypothetical protein